MFAVLFLKISLIEMHIKPTSLCFLKIFKMTNQTLRATGLRNLENPYGSLVARGTENEKTNRDVFLST